MRLAFLSIALPFVVFTRLASAEESAPTSDGITPVEKPPAVRLGVSGNGGARPVPADVEQADIGDRRTAGRRAARAPSPMHGFLIGYTEAGGIFGPTVRIVDAAYSLRLHGPDRLRGITGALYLEVGPSVGFAYVHKGDPTQRWLAVDCR